MEAFRDRFNAAELLSYKEVLYDEDTEEWYAPYDPKEVEREERNCMRIARQFYFTLSTYLINHSYISSARHLNASGLHLNINGTYQVADNLLNAIKL